MVFSSAIFIYLFLPAFLLGYYATPLRWRSFTILLGSYLFYAWWRVDFTLLLMGMTAFNYALSQRIIRADSTADKRLTFLAVAGNLCALGYFKFFDFGISSVNAIIGSDFSLWNIILPIGISFYIFQSISYIVDVHRKDIPPACNYIDFAAFIALFPQLIAGPVLRYKDIAPQFIQREHSLARFNEGALRFAMGFCKKILIADTLAPYVDALFALQNPTMAESWLAVLGYTAQLYFDFSGYSSMAIGLGLMMGFQFMENFNYPYLSRSITEFWRRWHISLSVWLKNYLYIPLGGNRKGTARTYINLFLTMLLGGLWHGANVTFLCWGAWHGIWLAIERALGGKTASPYPAWAARAFTALLVILGWVMFRAESMSHALTLYSGMLGHHGFALSSNSAWQLTPLFAFAMLCAYLIMFAAPHIWAKRPAGEWAKTAAIPLQFGVLLLFVIALCKLVGYSYSPFLYFQF